MRAPVTNEQLVLKIKALLRNLKIQTSDVAKRYGVSRTILYRYEGTVALWVMRHDLSCPYEEI